MTSIFGKESNFLKKGSVLKGLKVFGLVALGFWGLIDVPEIYSQDIQELPPLDKEVTLPANDKITDLGRIQDYYRTTKSFQAPFTQRSPDGSLANGTLYVERPGRLRFDYKDTIDLLVVSDGKILTMIDEEIGQVTRWPIADTPMRLLVAEQLDLTGLDARIDSAPGGVKEAIALIARDPDHPEFGSITVFFAEEENTIALKGWSIFDSRGGQTLVTIGKTDLNRPLEETLWTFKDPRGASRRIR